MRIISGKYGRRLIKAPKNLPVRPTTDLAKESLFNILANRISFNDKSILDLFSGTGSISYEFLSRGSNDLTSVEMNNNCFRFIKETSGKFQMGNHKVIRADVFRFLKTNKKAYDLIFADPPYSIPNFDELVDLIFYNSLLNKNGILIVEHPAEIDFSEHKYFLERRKYSKVNFSLFVYLPEN
ncbi:MAG: 16S rRNA (guanine(966)-N(2))-methyltransferase RsmD [Chlorobi bacterium]|nr:16S rRNA (guanine(966)-N(2))-methyltransferase RsmD [Chlorobiota bacterium]